MDTQELMALSREEIKIIFEDQQDLYTEEELAFLKQRYRQLLKEETETKEEKKPKRIPREMECPLCGAIVPTSNAECIYCQYHFKEEDYYSGSCEEDNEEDEDKAVQTGDFLSYFIAFLLPIVGIIMGLIYLGKERETFGKKLILFSVFCPLIIAAFIVFIYLLIAFSL